MSLTQRLTEYISACFSALWVQSFEHEDALREIAQMCREQNWRLASWDIEQGLQIPGQANAQPTDAGGSELRGMAEGLFHRGVAARWQGAVVAIILPSPPGNGKPKRTRFTFAARPRIGQAPAKHAGPADARERQAPAQRTAPAADDTAEHEPCRSVGHVPAGGPPVAGSGKSPPAPGRGSRRA